MLTSTQLRRFLRGHGQHCLGVFPLDQPPREIPKRRSYCFIVNTDPGHLPGKHWIAVHVSANGYAEVFDSFARLPPLLLQKWLIKYCKRWVHNSRFVQGPLTTLCGAYVLFFLSKRCYSIDSMRNIVRKEFSDNLSLNDVKMRRFMLTMFHHSM